MRRRVPHHVRVQWNGFTYSRDLLKCWHAYMRRVVDGEIEDLAGLAEAAGVARSTASRFMSGAQGSVGTTLKILRVLHLEFDDVHVLVDDGIECPEPEARPGPVERTR
jgi:transcriptional regulator with XRE-family HTH domain